VIPSVKHFLRNTFCSGFAKHDEIQLSAGLTGFPPVRKKEIFPAGCAKIGGKDMFRKDAFIQKLEFVGQRQVQHPSFPVPGLIKERSLLWMVCHGFENVLIDFIAARAYRRPEEGKDISRTGFKTTDKSIGGLFGNLQCGAFPTGMNGPDDPPDRVDKKDRNTIRRLDTEGSPGLVGHQGVKSRRWIVSRQWIGTINDPNPVLMNLIDQQELFGGETECRRDHLKILMHLICVISFPDADVQTGKMIFTDTALPGTKGMDEKITAVQIRRLQIF